MKKNVYLLSNVDCANCGVKIETNVGKLEGVSDCNFVYMTLKLYVTFDETKVNDDQIENRIHTSVSGVRIQQKNGAEFVDTYEEPLVFRKTRFGARRKNTRYMR